MNDPVVSAELPAGHQLGRYTVVRKLGRGGMGVVYLARDDRLGRDVALKLIAGLNDEATVQRFWREARAAASVNHPNVCQVFEIEETPVGICLAMELLEGESLDTRLERGALRPPEALQIALEMLAALGALHARGLVHRDVKPSNVFCTAHGVKLLDFGLARPTVDATLRIDASPDAPVTKTGMILGTPRYMAPEQIGGEPADGRTDLYATGAVLFELLAGRPPFVGDSVFDQMYATLHEKPPALQGPPAVIAIDRVIRRALEKDPNNRFPTAEAMARELAAISLSDGETTTLVPVRALMRLVVPPLRMLRADADASFLSFGLADAISGSLATLGDVVVRAPSVVTEWSEPGADPRRLAVQADVDLVIAGNLLRSGTQLRATVQLLEAATGTVLGAATVNGSMDDIFALEDALTREVIALLAPRRVDMSSEAAPVQRDVPATGRAFELFLRGLELNRSLHRAREARVLFEDAVREDPLFAPAWAALGRCHRVVGKYFEDRVNNERRAEDALRRALALSPNLPIAHRWLTHLEAEQGRADVAIARLLVHAKVNRNDAQLFAGLVHACRYAGLLEASVAAHVEARRLDPTVPTSVEYSYMLLSDEERLATLVAADRYTVDRDALLVLLAMRGKDDSLRAAFERIDPGTLPPGYVLTFDAVYATAFAPRDEAFAKLDAAVVAHVDPEALFLFAVGYLRLGAMDRAVELVRGIVAAGFTPLEMLEHGPVFEPMRQHAAFGEILDDARRRVSLARAIFERGNGGELLGV